jgi:hypothetical protein
MLTTRLTSERRRERPPRSLNTVAPASVANKRCHRLGVEPAGVEATRPPARGNDYPYAATCLARDRVLGAILPAVLSTKEVK